MGEGAYTQRSGCGVRACRGERLEGLEGVGESLEEGGARRREGGEWVATGSGGRGAKGHTDRPAYADAGRGRCDPARLADT